jgi:RNA polymerase sigma-70 factor, ECF subfamily
VKDTDMLRLQGKAALDSETEEALVRRAAAGDAEAFADLYACHLGPVYRYFYYRVGGVDDAEDLTEQLFLKVWRAMRSYDSRGVPFSAWVFRIAHNMVVDHRRAWRASEPLDEDLGIVDEAADVDAALMRRVEAEELVTALQQLSPVERSVVILRFVQEMDHRAVAAIVGKSEVATRSIQSRALAHLARILGPRGEGRL